ncbi:PQQ-dependent sugar dehydrogenase [Haloferula sargassicola]|uniref:Glucose/Sorbosone dehydrogenase domain-containing protein n=1 Tax=Haloferula sargassicola TaxID=490096 RepID=A0ABP9UI92_9BACT
MTRIPAAATALLLCQVAHADRVTHRWSFNAGGDASNGTELPDRITGEAAVVRGVGGQLDGSDLVLPGTTNGRQPPSSISAYLDLPNGLLSANPNLTLEIWATIDANRTWQRLFDFGRMDIAGDGLGAEGEITGSGDFSPGGTSSRDQFILSVSRDGNINQQRFSMRLDSGGEQSADSSLTTATGTEYHYTVTFESGVGTYPTTGGRMIFYRNGTQQAALDIDDRLTDLTDVNNWLGRSQWSSDSNSAISYNELRFHDHALSASEIAASTSSGPNASIAPSIGDVETTMLPGGKVRLDVLASAEGEVVASSVAITTPPLAGEAEVTADGTILYTQNLGSPEQDSFSYQVSNSSGDTTTGTATIHFADGLRFANPDLNVSDSPPATSLMLVDAFPGTAFDQPVAMASPPGDASRLFVVEKTGLLRVIPDVTNPSPTASTFLDLPSVLSGNGESLDTGGESGFLGLAFHPDYASNRHFYVFYSVTSGGSRYQRVARFTTRSGNPAAADPSSQLILINQLDEASNHNGGDIHFGPDGYLYISVGDEGGGNDTYNNSQKITGDLFSGILRIDVDKQAGNVAPTPHAAIPTDGGQARFAIPVDNPFVHTSLGGSWDGTYNGSGVSTTTVRREFFATGLRNPWRFSFDPLNGELWCGDVGQGAWEEIDVISLGDNCGWAYREGTHNGPRSAPADFDSLYHAPPVYEYPRGGEFGGYSVTGGRVYRGNRIGSLHGKYIFADYGSGNIWSLTRNVGSAPTVERLFGESGIVGFGVDPSNQDLLLADIDSGLIRRITQNVDDSTFPPTLSATGLFADVADLSPAPGVTPYDVNLPFWSDHAIKSRWFIIPDATSQLTWAEEDPWTLPSGMIWVKHFDLELERGNPATKKRLETRLIVRNDEGAYGVSYRWNEEETEAYLVGDAGEDFDLEITDDGSPTTQTWHIPSRAECLTCHTPQAGHALSFNTRQLNRDHDMLGYSGNQLATLASEGFFTNSPSDPDLLPRHLRPDETAYSVEGRVRSYLDVNCAYCHMAGGTAGGAEWDGREPLTLAETGLIHGAANNNLGDPANQLVVPGDALHSVVLQRVAASNGFTRMPPLATKELDTVAIDLLTEWITAKLPAQPDYAAWRLAAFGSDSSPEGEPGEDPDLDGVANRDEFLHGTEPLDPSSRLRPEVAIAGGPRLSFTLPENRSYRVMTSSDLATWTPWDVPGNQGLPVAGGLIEVAGPLDTARRFFQLEVTEN